MAYRSVDPAIQERIEAAEAEIAALDGVIATQRAELVRFTTSSAALRKRLDREGAGGGERGAWHLRVPVVTVTLLTVNTFLLPLHYMVGADLRDVRALLIGSFTFAPLAIATFIAFRFRAALRSHWLVSLGFCALTFTVIVYGWLTGNRYD